MNGQKNTLPGIQELAGYYCARFLKLISHTFAFISVEVYPQDIGHRMDVLVAPARHVRDDAADLLRYAPNAFHHLAMTFSRSVREVEAEHVDAGCQQLLALLDSVPVIAEDSTGSVPAVEGVSAERRACSASSK